MDLSEIDLIDGPKYILVLVLNGIIFKKKVWVVKFNTKNIINNLKYENIRADGDFSVIPLLHYIILMILWMPNYYNPNIKKIKCFLPLWVILYFKSS